MAKDINRIKVVLVEKKRTNKWLAEALQKDPATVSKWCTNVSQPSIETLVNKLKTDMTNTTAAHKYIMQFENQLMDDWRKFKDNPKWLVKYLRESNIKD